MPVLALDELIPILQSYVADGNRYTNELRNKFDESEESAHAALEWLDRTFEVVSLALVAKRCLEAIETQTKNGSKPVDIVRHLAKHAHDKSIHAARYPTRSSSVSGSFLAACDGASWARLYELIETGF